MNKFIVFQHQLTHTVSVIIIGCSLVICFAGWLVMFIYYNTCALPMRQYTTYTNGPKLEEPSVSHVQPTDTTQIKYINEHESLASSKRYMLFKFILKITSKICINFRYSSFINFNTPRTLDTKAVLEGWNKRDRKWSRSSLSILSTTPQKLF